MRTHHYHKLFTQLSILVAAAAITCGPVLGDTPPATQLTPAPLPTARQNAGLHASDVVVPDGNRINVILQSDIGSRVSQNGGTFAVLTAEDYLVDGMLVLPKGSPGYGTITDVRRAANGRVPGSIAFEVTRLIAPSGAVIATQTVGNTADAVIHNERNGSDTMQFLLWGVWGSAMKRGDDQLIKAGEMFHVSVVAGQHAHVVAPGSAAAALDTSQVKIPIQSPAPEPSDQP